MISGVVRGWLLNGSEGEIELGESIGTDGRHLLTRAYNVVPVYHGSAFARQALKVGVLTIQASSFPYSVRSISQQS